jgi:uncharacterized protein (TIGR02266 family)
MKQPLVPDGRRARRLHHDLVVTYRSVGRFLSDWVTDISRGGLFINSRSPLPVGTVVKLIIQLPGAAFPFDLVGRVQRTVPWGNELDLAPGMGIEFTDVDRDKRDRIDAFVEELRGRLDPG